MGVDRRLARYSDYVGKRFGKRVVLSVQRDCGRIEFICKCDCGNEHIVRRAAHLRDHNSCKRCVFPDENKPGHGKIPLYPSWQARKTPEYTAWKNARDRCNMPSHRSYARYGGRGIKLCEHWACGDKGYKQFLADVGKRPHKGLQLDRIDNDKGYLCPLCCPPDGNCRWTTPLIQRLNQRPQPPRLVAKNRASFPRPQKIQRRSESMRRYWANQSEEYRKSSTKKAQAAWLARPRCL